MGSVTNKLTRINRFARRFDAALGAGRTPSTYPCALEIADYPLRRIDGELEVSEMDGIKENIEFRLPAELRT